MTFSDLHLELVQEREPRKEDDPGTMHHGDVVNVVDISTNDVLDHAMEFTTNQPVDFLYEAAKRSMKIRVNYNRILAQHPLVTTTLRLNNVELPDKQRNQQEVRLTVEYGTFFLREGSLVEVVNVNDNNDIVQDDETANEYIIDLYDAARLIRNFLE